MIFYPFASVKITTESYFIVALLLIYVLSEMPENGLIYKH